MASFRPCTAPASASSASLRFFAMVMNIGEAFVGLLAGSCHTILHCLNNIVVALHGGSGGGSKLSLGRLTGILERLVDSCSLGLHLGLDHLGIGNHASSLLIKALVHLSTGLVRAVLNVLGTKVVAHLVLVGQEGLVLSSDSIIEEGNCSL